MTSDSEGPPDAVVDHDLCAGVAQCVRLAPGAFQLDDELLGVFAPSAPYTTAELDAAVDNCPMAAIRLTRGVD